MNTSLTQKKKYIKIVNQNSERYARDTVMRNDIQYTQIHPHQINIIHEQTFYHSIIWINIFFVSFHFVSPKKKKGNKKFETKRYNVIVPTPKRLLQT